jgi:hypothetical protein
MTTVIRPGEQRLPETHMLSRPARFLGREAEVATRDNHEHHLSGVITGLRRPVKKGGILSMKAEQNHKAGRYVGRLPQPPREYAATGPAGEHPRRAKPRQSALRSSAQYSKLV